MVLRLPETAMVTGVGLLSSGGVSAWSRVLKLFKAVQRRLALSDISRMGCKPLKSGTPTKSPPPEVAMVRSPAEEGKRIAEVSITKPPAPAITCRLGGNKIGMESPNAKAEGGACGAPKPVISTALP